MKGKVCDGIKGMSRMVVIFTSQSDKKAIKTSRSRFSEDGRVPVNYTAKDNIHADWENEWIYMPHMKALAAMAGLLHDVGKNWMFEPKLYPMFYQEDTHSHFVEANNERFFFECLMYELCFVWELNDFEGYDDEYSDFARERDVFLDKDKVEPSKEYVYIGSYIYGQEEPHTLGLSSICRTTASWRNRLCMYQTRRRTHLRASFLHHSRRCNQRTGVWQSPFHQRQPRLPAS